VENVSGDDTLRLEFSGAVTGVEVASTTNWEGALPGLAVVAANYYFHGDLQLVAMAPGAGSVELGVPGPTGSHELHTVKIRPVNYGLFSIGVQIRRLHLTRTKRLVVSLVFHPASNGAAAPARCGS
jgi:hypothetical protein